ncbi:MAG: hypothetical protein BJ554DRAFT_4191 [Olpidium bornovanus]|uniref:Uncharacterized protein n=1 Tax=Olpidium bornovanus TaxID=278681 RepID=A0A8H7ZN48_9FUNG|nr:MAG: hypothetical protein BJ554DRAFT_4191 [Olpidium bornovanus]
MLHHPENAAPETEPIIQQVELNTIAASFSSLSAAAGDLHRYVLQSNTISLQERGECAGSYTTRTGFCFVESADHGKKIRRHLASRTDYYQDNAENAPEPRITVHGLPFNRSSFEIAKGIAKAHELYNREKCRGCRNGRAAWRAERIRPAQDRGGPLGEVSCQAHQEHSCGNKRLRKIVGRRGCTYDVIHDDWLWLRTMAGWRRTYGTFWSNMFLPLFRLQAEVSRRPSCIIAQDMDLTIILPRLSGTPASLSSGPVP